MPSIALTYHSMLADAYGATGDYRAQQAAAEQAIAMIETHQERFLAAELYCLLGDAYAAQGLQQQARDAWQMALDIARRQGAKPFEQRALDSLASQGGNLRPAFAM